MKVKALKFMKNHGFHRNTEMGIFHGRRPISQKMSRLWNRELGLVLNNVQSHLQYLQYKRNRNAVFVSFYFLAGEYDIDEYL